MVTKRQLGVGIAALGLVLGIAILATDWIGAGNEIGIGPMQRLALLGAGALVVLGVTLIPFGERPA